MSSIVCRLPKPGVIETCKPTLATKPPTGAGWVHEIKWDGYCARAHLSGIG